MSRNALLKTGPNSIGPFVVLCTNPGRSTDLMIIYKMGDVIDWELNKTTRANVPVRFGKMDQNLNRKIPVPIVLVSLVMPIIPPDRL